MLLPDIRWWNELALEMLESSLSRRLVTVGDVVDQLADIGKLPGWEGEAAVAARRSFTVTTDQLIDEAATLGAVKELTTQTREAVAHLKQTLATIEQTAAANGLEIWDAGHVTIADAPNAPDPAKLESLRLELQDAVHAVMKQADDINADAAAVLNRAADGKIDDKGATDVTTASTAGATQGGLTAPAPPENATPQQNKEYWDAMDERQRREVIAQHPEWIGNRDGIPSMARHEANVNRIDDERARLTRERDALQEQLKDAPDGSRYPNAPDPYAADKQKLAQVQAKLKDLDSLESTLKDHPLDPANPDTGARLLLLDMQSGDKGMAAIAVGDPDNADHVSVTVPGVSTTVQSLDGMTKEAVALQTEAQRQLDAAGRDNERVASIAWLGYEPPPDLGVEAASSERAKDGAPKLANFFDGIEVASNKPDPHITALGHSYGSYTTALALQDAGPSQPVDDAVFYGSPGINANDEPDLGLPQGHGYVMRAPDDPISLVDGFGVLGPDPVTTKLEQLSVAEATTKDGVHREDSNGHSEYPRPSANGELRTAAYNMAVVVAGLPERAER
ncbi:alpha/beta hydrolase family protein [Nocardia tenerifensis]|uniref:Alpha/beta hydrolase family protein n=2 Tax=Nocardia tenerifensis TaxID=228006 RepID=A0A318JSH4_9NOCA|nr:alpha/beta hydrolase [Nocardia tenerifensis]PXX53398.1 alpha/beta hydrolase family protein [Nocardia tenerifensis]